MPLSDPAPRKLMHLRDLELRGYAREDGLFDIEARLTDTKTYGFPNDNRGHIQAGEPLHGMVMRMTVDGELTIIACEAETEHGPYGICPQAAPNFSRLAGVRIGAGFRNAIRDRVGGVQGCTHLREMLAQMATVAFQTISVIRKQRDDENATGPDAKRPAVLNTCLAYADDGDLVAKRWPAFARRAPVAG